MVRNLLVASLALALAPAGLLAEQIQGTIKSVSPTKNSITVMVGQQERTLDCAKDCRVVTMVTTGARRRATSSLQEVSGGLNNIQQGAQVTLTTQTRSGAEVVTQVQSQNLSGNTGGFLRRRR